MTTVAEKRSIKHIGGTIAATIAESGGKRSTWPESGAFSCSGGASTRYPQSGATSPKEEQSATLVRDNVKVRLIK
jgi:hypothetical protein